MRMIYVGSLSMAPDRDSHWIREFGNLGWNVSRFKSDVELTGPSIQRKMKRRFGFGREARKINEDLLDLVQQTDARWVHFRLPVGFDSRTIAALKRRRVIVTEYFNDDPFSQRALFGFYWKFRKALPFYDAHFVYRKHNIDTFKKAGAERVEHCPPAFDPLRHASSRFENGRFEADAAFIGHYENDWRVECLDALKCAGLNVVLKGGGWDRHIRAKAISSEIPVRHAFGPEYNHIYANVVAGLCFFSKLNNDGWTERALEIVAVGGVLVCERTPEAESMFVDRKEAFYFSSVQELIHVVRYLKDNPVEREKIRVAGSRRLQDGAHTIQARAMQVNRFVRGELELRGKKC